jgi:cephalosporin-C deacetylase-like acetyl esterase
MTRLLIMAAAASLVPLLNHGVVEAAESGPKFEEIVRAFDYDRNAPLNVREEKSDQRDGTTVIELSYDSPRGGRVPATLVVPPGKGPFAGVLFGHWMMPKSPVANRKEFLEEALLLASAGAVSLLTDAPLVRPGFIRESQGSLRGLVQGAEASRQQVIDFRRGVDLLVARKEIDGARLAYVGHSYNAHTGGILAAVEKRIASFVLMAGEFADEEYIFNFDSPAITQFRHRNGEKELRDFFRQYAFDDPVHFASHSAPSAVFLQFGRRDEGIPEKFARGYFERFAEPKRIEFYDAGHALNKEAREERVEWLAERLKLKKIDREAVERVPNLEGPEKEEDE